MGPVLEQMVCTGPEWDACRTWDRLGAKAANTSSHSATHTCPVGRRRVKGCALAMEMSPQWPMCWPMPAGAICDTGTLISDLLSTPLAFLNVRVKGMAVSFCKGSFRSISMMW